MRGISSHPDRPTPANLLTVATILTGALHLGAFLLTLAAPHLFLKKIDLPEVCQVRLYTAAELPPAPAPSQPKTAVMETPPRMLPTTGKPPARHAPPATKRPVSPMARSLNKPEAVSLAPLKNLLLKENQERQEKEAKKRQVASISERLKLEQEKRQSEAHLRETTRSAREALAESYRAAQPRTPVISEITPGKPKAEVAGNNEVLQTPTDQNGNTQQEALAAYGARLKAHIRPHWVLPEQQDWDRKLSATIVMRIKRDGSVTTPPWLDKNSGNNRFDQYVRKAVNNSLPLPPLPPELGKNSEEIGVTFTPGGLK